MRPAKGGKLIPPPIRLRKIIPLSVALGIFALSLRAQKTSPPGGGGSTPPVTSRPPSNLPPPGGTPNTPDLTNNGLYLTGKVMMEDGTPPPELVTIERVCSGSPKAQGYTDQKGNFSFQLGQTNAVFQDASEDSTGMIYGNKVPSGNNPLSGSNPNAPPATSPSAQPSGTGIWQLANCELRAVLAGYRSDTVNLAGRRRLDDPDVGTLVLHRLANVSGTVVSVTSLEAPRNAQRAYDKGRHALEKGNGLDAIESFQKAVELFPRFAAAWYALGRMQENIRNVPEARRSYQAALAADPKFLGPYMPLASMAADEHNWQEVAGITGRLLKLDPVDYVAGWLFNAAANFNLGRMDEAERSARAGQRLDTGNRYPKLGAVLGSVLVRKGDSAGAAELLHAYLAAAPEDEDTPRLRKELARAESLSAPNQHAKAAAKPEPAQSGQPDPQ